MTAALTPIVPVLLCGGSGTRLWPLSRKAMPKQFAPLIGDQTLYQAALQRLSGPGWAAPVVVTAEPYVPFARSQAAGAGVALDCLMVEPSPRNTAPAILAAALQVSATNPDALMLIAPSDHAIPDAAAFREAVRAGVAAAQRGQIVTFGIKPTRAETGYGWLELAADPGDFAPRPLPLSRFVEKPKAALAEAMLAAGTFLWNAGIFLTSARTLIEAFSRHAPQLLLPVHSARHDMHLVDGAMHLGAAAWNSAEDISVDYAVMERAANLCVVPFAAGWSDLGDWSAIWRDSSPDADGMVTTGDVTAIGCAGSLLRSDTEGVELVGIGLTDTVVVAMGDAILVAHKSRVQEVKEALARLKAKRAVQAEAFGHKDPSWSETRVADTRYGARVVHLGAHGEMLVPATAPECRWMVMSGRAVITMEADLAVVNKGGSLWRRKGVTARIANPDAEPLVLVEAQIGGVTQTATIGHPVSVETFAFAAE